MKITKIKIDNYRLLKEFEIDLEDDLSLIIGKNNCGKTSLLSLLERFLIADQNSFSFNDINLDKQKGLKAVLSQPELDVAFDFGIKLRLYISYSDDDNLSNISSLMLNLNPSDNIVVLAFEYSMNFEDAKRLKSDYESFKTSHLDKDERRDILFFLKKFHKNYFRIHRKALEHEKEDNFIEIKDKNEVNKIICFKRIKAKRGVINSDGTQKSSDKTLSRLSSDYYDKVFDAEDESKKTKDLREKLSETDIQLTQVYEGIFEDVVNKVKRFGGVKLEDSIIRVESTLEEKNILRDNTSVVYSQSEHTLPEDYNGLGYMNLIAMIFEIEVILNDFKKKRSKLEKPSDINLFFIEEPEAHTHPQMQYVFIKNIKAILKEESEGINDNVKINLQTLISTHSCHITAESNFDDIKYFYKDINNSVTAKNVKLLKEQYKNDPKQYDFLRQYLTLNRAELFFADKAILIEGDTERILLPTIMKKLDIECKNEDIKNNILPLLSQNISIIEVGAFSQIFEKFIHFIGIKALVITDIDTVDDNDTACKVLDGVSFSNSAIQYFMKDITLKDLKSLRIEEKKLLKDETLEEPSWIVDEIGILCLVFQVEEESYHARSFEDAFIHINREFINSIKDQFRGLKNRKYFEIATNDAYDLAANCVAKKTHFALDILFHSNEDFSNWRIPSYIKEGLLWLKK